MNAPAPPSKPDHDAALELIRGALEPTGSERVPLGPALGRVLRETVCADRDQPPFDRATMDGYAVRAEEVRVGVPVPVAGRVPAGRAWTGAVPPGACVAIATGAPVPAGLDTVIEHERSDRGTPVRFRSVVARGSSIHPRGADARAGDPLLHPGTVLRPQHLGAAAAVGRSDLLVACRPRVAVLTSGDEIVPVGAAAEPQQIRNSNGPVLAALVERFGGVLSRSEHVADERTASIDALRSALDRCDVVVTVGGISAGERDWFPAALEALHVTLLVRGAAIQPGGPITVGRRPGGGVVVALPGNPVSVLACAHLFLWPLVRSALGVEPALPWCRSVLREPVRPNARRRGFRPGRFDDAGGVAVLPWGGSGDLASTIGADALVELPVQDDPVPAGTVVRTLRLP